MEEASTGLVTMGNGPNRMQSTWRLLKVAGRDERELDANCSSEPHKLVAHWHTQYPLGTGTARRAFVARSEEGLLDQIRSRRSAPNQPVEKKPRIALIFPGLGNDDYSNALKLIGSHNGFVSIFQRAESVLESEFGSSMRDSLKRHSASLDKTRSQISKTLTVAPTLPTVIAHSALLTIEYILAQIWIDAGVTPDIVIGYSLGEYAASVIAGAFDFETALKITIERARLLSTIDKSGMLAVHARAEDLRLDREPEIHLVSESSDNQLIVGSKLTRLIQFKRRLDEAGLANFILPVEYAFHTPLMKPAAARMDFRFEPSETGLKVPLISTLTGTIATAAELRSTSHWSAHLSNPVRFRDAADEAVSAGANVFLEIGPSQSLTPLLLSRYGEKTSIQVQSTLPSDYAKAEPIEQVLRTGAALWARGIDLNLPRFDGIGEPEHTQDSTPPRTAGSIHDANLIASLWANALGVKTLQPGDDIFRLGANSLTCARIARMVHEATGISVPIKLIFAEPTPKGFASALAGIAEQDDVHHTMMLPNGMLIYYQSKAEADYFYESIFSDRSYLKHGLAINPGDVVIDAGANIGTFSLFASLEAPNVRIIAVEPVPVLFRYLTANLENIVENPILINAGLSNVPETLPITFYPNSPGMSTFVAERSQEALLLETIVQNSSANGDKNATIVLGGRDDFIASRLVSETLDCKLITLSQIIRDHRLERVDLLKIDVQKYELRVLQGLNDEHWPRIRQVVAEVHDDDGRLDEFSRILRSRGYCTEISQDSSYTGTNMFMIYARRN